MLLPSSDLRAKIVRESRFDTLYALNDAESHVFKLNSYSCSGLTRGRSLLLVDLDHVHVQKFHNYLAPNSIQLEWVICLVFRKMYRKMYQEV